MENNIYDIIIIGAGASGLFCALNISAGKSILILDGSDSPAKKLLMSAKGRGNLTNHSINPEIDYASDNPLFVKCAFETYCTKDFLDFLKNEGIDYCEEDFGRILLKSHKVSQFHQYLVGKVIEKKISILYNEKVKHCCKSNMFFCISTENTIFYAKNVVVATGGPSFPNLGATEIAINIAKSFNLETTKFSPALVGFETNQDFYSLSGSSVIGKITLKDGNNVLYNQIGPVLFTHRGLSGPCIFNASLFLRGLYGNNENNLKVLLEISSKDITKRLLSFLGFHNNKLSVYKISSNVKCIRGFDEAKVSSGGVKTKNLNTTFECKDIPGLYFIGECLDVTGKTGGFNLQWCRTSAAICAKNLDKQNP